MFSRNKALICIGILVMFCTIMMGQETWAQDGTLKWPAYATGGAIYTPPAIGPDGTVYVVSTANEVHAIDPVDGTPKWAGPFIMNGSMGYAAPAIGSDAIYVVTDFGGYGNETGYVYAINLDNGTEKWSYGTYRADFDNTPSIGPDRTVYAVGSGGLNAFNPANGDIKWTLPSVGHSDSSTAVGEDGTIYLGSRDLVAVSPYGIEKWRFTPPVGITSSPAIDKDGNIYFSAGENLYAVDSEGNEKWVFPVPYPASSKGFRSPVLGPDDTIYVLSTFCSGIPCHYGVQLHAITLDGTEKYPPRDMGTVGYLVSEAAPAIGADSTIYLGLYGRLYAIDRYENNWRVKWTFITGGSVQWAPTIAGDGTVYIGSGDGNLYAVETTCGGSADSDWPMFHNDARHTGRVRPSLYVYPNKGGNTGSTSVNIYGHNHPDVASVKLLKQGQAAILGDPVTVKDGGGIITTLFNLDGIEIGSWDIVIKDQDGRERKTPDPFVVVQSESISYIYGSYTDCNGEWKIAKYRESDFSRVWIRDTPTYDTGTGKTLYLENLAVSDGYVYGLFTDETEEIQKVAKYNEEDLSLVWIKDGPPYDPDPWAKYYVDNLTVSENHLYSTFYRVLVTPAPTYFEMAKWNQYKPFPFNLDWVEGRPYYEPTLNTKYYLTDLVVSDASLYGLYPNMIPDGGNKIAKYRLGYTYYPDLGEIWIDDTPSYTSKGGATIYMTNLSVSGGYIYGRFYESDPLTCKIGKYFESDRSEVWIRDCPFITPEPDTTCYIEEPQATSYTQHTYYYEEETTTEDPVTEGPDVEVDPEDVCGPGPTKIRKYLGCENNCGLIYALQCLCLDDSMYNIESDACIVPPITIRFMPQTVPTAPLRILHKEGDTFVDRTIFYDPQSNVLIGRVNSFSDFMVVNDCVDADGDDYGHPGNFLCPYEEEDCDDSDPDVNPGTTEIPGNGKDDDCNPRTPGWGTPSSVVGAEYKGASDIVNYLFLLCVPVGALLLRRGLRRRR